MDAAGAARSAGRGGRAGDARAAARDVPAAPLTGDARAVGRDARAAARGRLVLVGTPIGNLGDLSPRAEQALREADTVLAEDTRVTGRLLAAFGIEARLERCDENVIAGRAPALVGRMLGGERMALVSDAGMPAVADPGARLADAALDAGVPVDVVPGPSAVTCALAAAGFACEAFYFGGFLPRKDAERDRLLSSLAALPAVLAFYESPHRVQASLAAVARAFPGRRAALARELTKLHQEVARGLAGELAAEVAGRPEPLRGECVILVDAPGQEELERARRAQEAARLAAELAGMGGDARPGAGVAVSPRAGGEGATGAGAAASAGEGGAPGQEAAAGGEALLGMGAAAALAGPGAVPGQAGVPASAAPTRPDAAPGQGAGPFNAAAPGWAGGPASAATPGRTGGLDLDAVIRAGLAAGARKSALAKRVAAASGMTRAEAYDRICEVAAEVVQG